MFCDECAEVCDQLRTDQSADPLVSVSMNQEHFVFTVETNGALPPEELVQSAIVQLKAKFAELSNSLQHFDQGDDA